MADQLQYRLTKIETITKKGETQYAYDIYSTDNSYYIIVYKRNVNRI